MVTKTDQVLLRRLEIARLLVNGADWPEIAAWLRSEGIKVSTGQARVYWWRHYRDVPAAVIVAEAEAAIWAERCAAMEKQIADLMSVMEALQLQAAAAQTETAELRTEVRRLESERQYWLTGEATEAAKLPSSPQASMPAASPALMAARTEHDMERTPGGHADQTGMGQEPLKRDEAAPPARQELSGFTGKGPRMGLLPDLDVSPPPPPPPPPPPKPESISGAPQQKPRRELSGFTRKGPRMGLVPRTSGADGK